jgi:hypothetical protein
MGGAIINLDRVYYRRPEIPEPAWHPGKPGHSRASDYCSEDRLTAPAILPARDSAARSTEVTLPDDWFSAWAGRAAQI